LAFSRGYRPRGRVVLVVVGSVGMGSEGRVVLGVVGTVGVGMGGTVGVVVPDTFLKAMFTPPAKVFRELEIRLGSSASMEQSLLSVVDVPHVPVPTTPVITVKLVGRMRPV
jgi:hypothetical protein